MKGGGGWSQRHVIPPYIGAKKQPLYVCVFIEVQKLHQIICLAKMVVDNS